MAGRGAPPTCGGPIVRAQEERNPLLREQAAMECHLIASDKHGGFRKVLFNINSLDGLVFKLFLYSPFSSW